MKTHRSAAILSALLAIAFCVHAPAGAPSLADFSGDAAALARLKDAPDARPLIDADLSNASFRPGTWSWDDGVLASTGESTLITRAGYGDFRLGLEFRCEEKAMSGLFLRCSDPQNVRQSSIHIQIAQAADGNKRRRAGALYDCAAPSRKVKIEPGKWHRLQVSAVGARLVVLIDGKSVVQANLDDWTTLGQNPDGTDNYFRNALRDFARSGRIALSLAPGVTYRNLIIAPVQSGPDTVSSRPGAGQP
jgi:hypothetical protein